ncbi:MAG: murein biosynthesis integral membrane protein MurJ [Chloroflexi bacterium]|nr:murein biosynthesis integral membrane protein MurJ [Chloroflexota bacterium]
MSGSARDLARAGMVVTSALFVSRILGWVRVAVIAASLGIGRELDVYTAAFRIPDFLFQLVAAGALASAVIPTIAALVRSGEQERAWRVVSTIANLLMLVLAALAIATFVAAPALAPLIAPGFGPAATEQLVELTRILLLSPIFLALSAVATSILNSAGRFAASVMAPIVYNLSIIAAAIFLVPQFGLAGLAWGTVAGAVATLAVQVLPVVRQVGFHYTPRVDLRDAEARRTLVLLGPRAIGMAGGQLTLLMLTILGSTLAPGAIGAFGLAFTIFQIPLGTIAYPLGIVALPALSTRIAGGEIDEYVGLVTRALRLLGFAMLPIACIAAGVALQVVDLVVDFGEVDDAGIALTGAAFLGLLAALPSEAMIIVLSRAFFAARNTWIPVGAALASVLVAVVTATLLVGPLGIFGLALGVTVASWVEAVLLLGAFRHRHAGFGLLRLGRAHLWYLAAAAVAGLVADRAYDLAAGALSADPGALATLVVLAAVGALGLLVYVALAALLRVPELPATVRLVRTGLRRGAA